MSDVLLPLRDDKQINKTHPLPTTTSKSSKNFHETELTKSYSKTKHLSASADTKSRPKLTRPQLERPLKEQKSEQSVTKPLRATKIFEQRHEWVPNTNCHGDYFQPVLRQSPSETGCMSGGKKSTLQHRRNSTSFSTVTIGGDAEYGSCGKQRHGVITASALMDLRTSIR
ncbi:hypothetical protein HF086_003280 [Spodoptera exigua]|uniref:Uncharacterized protein n=1 Tax=Spodoptera exigua TaxID=7107 RepID=A0A922MGZ7_SPOEX|nr:hypothetical protein HF086_003280 [Spodoptera exigua]